MKEKKNVSNAVKYVFVYNSWFGLEQIAMYACFFRRQLKIRKNKNIDNKTENGFSEIITISIFKNEKKYSLKYRKNDMLL